MPEYIGRGTGRHGDLVVSGTQTISNLFNSSITQAAGDTNATLDTGLTISANDLVYIHQTQGTNHGRKQRNQVVSYNSGTGATVFRDPADYAFSSSGGNKAQCIGLKEYSSISLPTTSDILEPTAWDGTKFGILSFLCTGAITGNGKLNVKGKGFRGGAGGASTNGGAGQVGEQGEGYGGTGTRTTSANFSGGGGGGAGGGDGAGGGGGGGNKTAGTNGLSGQNGGGTGGTTASSTDGTVIDLGGGGGGGGGESNANAGSFTGGAGGRGGGFIDYCADRVAATVQEDYRGDNGSAATGAYQEGSGGGGAGAAGAGYKRTSQDLNGANMTVTGGTGGSSAGTFAGNGSTGGDGITRREACNIDGTSSPASSEVEGGLSWCSATSQII